MSENKSTWMTITQCSQCGQLNPAPTRFSYHRGPYSAVVQCGPVETYQMIPMGQWDHMIDAANTEVQARRQAEEIVDGFLFEKDKAYRERNRLVAALTRHYRPAYYYMPLGENDWPIVYIETPAGQLSWHIPSTEAVELGIADLPTIPEGYVWDGHTDEEKYERLARLSLVDSRHLRSLGLGIENFDPNALLVPQ